MSEKQIKKIILAYSGGLDTTVILHWLKDQYDAEVIAFTADIGQDHDPELVRDRAASIGASKIIIEDLKRNLPKNIFFLCLKQTHSMKASTY
jgi:argininosuccinate synthase